MFKFKKLRTRIIVWILGMALLLSLSLSFINCLGDYNSAKRQMDELLSLSSSSYGLALENYLENLQQEIVTLAVSGGLTDQGLSHEKRQENLDAVLRARPDISGLYTVGSDGISINDSDFTFEDSSGEDYSEEEFFQTAMASDGIWIDDPSYDDWTDNITLTITYRYRDNTGFIGIIGMDIHYDVLLDIVSQGSIGETGYSVLVSETGQFITHPDSSYVLDEINYLEDLESEPDFGGALQQIVGAGDGRIDEIKYQGENVLLYYHTIEDTGWTFVTIAKPSEFMGEFYASLQSTVLTVAFWIVLSILIAIYIAGAISKPITAMSERMKLFAQGDLHTPMPKVKSQDELKTLQESLSSSVSALNLYITDISDKLQSVSDGDITSHVDIDYVGDFAPIKENLNKILSSLNGIMGSIKDSSQGVSSTSIQMADAAQSLSDTTISQAGTIDMLSNSFKEIKEGLAETANNTTAALDKTAKATEALKESKTSMDHMNQTMEEINSASAAIEKIIKSIDDIAFQTNILALNAAVEAARAGAAGKGFSVVAEEVRSLSAKSADAASQTGRLIQNSISAVSRGNDSVKETSEQIVGLESLVADVAALVREIEGEANREAASAAELYDGIEQLNGMVQNSSAMAEETASASQEMEGQAKSLDDALSFFRLQDGQDTY